MNRMVLLIVMLLSLVGWAEEKKAYDPSKQRPTTAEEKRLRKQWIEKRRYEHFGGDMVRPGSQRGQITIVDCQSSVPKAIIEEGISYLIKETRFNIVRQEGKFAGISPTLVGDFSLYVIDDVNQPRMLVALEDRWAILNVSSLKTGRGTQPQFLKARVLKELSRTFAALCGAMSSDFPDSLTTGIYNLDQLDRQEDNRLSVDVIARFAPSLANAKITPAEMTTYRKAVREGWAPAPTNDIQKAIWEQVKADKERGPTNPIKIPMPKKK